MIARRLMSFAAVWLGSLALIAAQGDKPDRKVWDGVFTPAQAARGKERFETTCARCHNVALVGSERGPALKGNAFVGKWDNDSLGSIYTKMRDTMPPDGAGLVADALKVDILAYILQSNGLPPGPEELTGEASSLDAIKIAKKTVWDGVFTAAQADRGKSHYLGARCGGCHQLDLTGDRGPALKGADFMAHWENGSLNALFTKLKDTMPQNDPQAATDETKIDIVAYLLQVNGFPAGKSDLTLDPNVLDNTEIVRKGALSGAPNFSLVQVVGCLEPGANNAWTLARTSEPVVTKDEEPTPTGLRAAGSKPLGTQTFQLVSAAPYKPETRKGQKVEARGLLYRDGSDARLNLTSLQTLAPACDR